MVKKLCAWCHKVAWHNPTKSEKFAGAGRCTACGHPPGNVGPGWRYEYNVKQRQRLSGSLV